MMVHLGQLVSRHKERPDLLHDRLNVSKRQRVHAVIALCLSGKAEPYNFSALPGVGALFDAAPRIETDRELDEEAQRRAEEPPELGTGQRLWQAVGRAAIQWHSGNI